MTFREIKAMLDTFTEEQLNQEVMYYPYGYPLSESEACEDEELNLEIADFDLYYSSEEDSWAEPGYNAIPAEEYLDVTEEELKEIIENGGEYGDYYIKMSEIKRGMPYINKKY